MINVMKHTFPEDRPDGQVVVSYEIDGSDWKVVLSDIQWERKARCRRQPGHNPRQGALAGPLDAKVEVVSGWREGVAYARDLYFAAAVTCLTAPGLLRDDG